MPTNPFKLPFAEAIAYFQGKVPIPTESWRDIRDEEHDFAFVIAGLTRADLLNDAQWLIGRAIEDGTDIEVFKQQFRRLIERKGWSPNPLPVGPSDYRYRIILETNVRQAYRKGRVQQIRQVSDRRPYLMWRWRDSPNPRPAHQALDGKVFLASDPFWDVAFPPCGYGCRCTAFTLSERQLQTMGKRPETPPDPLTIAEPGFRKASPAAKEERSQILKQAMDRLSPELQKQVRSELK